MYQHEQNTLIHLKYHYKHFLNAIMAYLIVQFMHMLLRKCGVQSRKPRSGAFGDIITSRRMC